MNLEFLLTDKPLCLFVCLLLAFWAVAKFKLARRGGVDWEAICVTTLRMGSGALMILASADKLGDPASFLKAVENYHVLPGALVPVAAVVIPWLEFFIGICLGVGFRSRGSALVLCALMGAYSLGLATNLVRGVEMNCSCFSTASTEKITWLTVLRDFLIFLMGSIVLTSRSSFASLDGFLRRKLKP